jgi:hypothetical protein
MDIEKELLKIITDGLTGVNPPASIFNALANILSLAGSLFIWAKLQEIREDQRERRIKFDREQRLHSDGLLKTRKTDRLQKQEPHIDVEDEHEVL